MIRMTNQILRHTALVLGVSCILIALPRSYAQNIEGRKPVTVRVIDAVNQDPFNLRRIRHEDDSHVIPKAEGISKTIAAIRKTVKSKECINKLIFHGHGRPGAMSIGTGDSYAPAEFVLNDNPNTEKLQSLKDLLCKKGESSEIEITFRGCCFGAWEEGSQKLHKIAKFFDDPALPPVCVLGATGSLRTDATSRTNQRGEVQYLWIDLMVEGGVWQKAKSTDPAPPKPMPRVMLRKNKHLINNPKNQPVQVKTSMEVIGEEAMTNSEVQQVNWDP